jgi:hypothetical protein
MLPGIARVARLRLRRVARRNRHLLFRLGFRERLVAA